jgi:hypothetical protein
LNLDRDLDRDLDRGDFLTAHSAAADLPSLRADSPALNLGGSNLCSNPYQTRTG